MPIDDIFGPTVGLLGKSIDLITKDHNRISANIANAETPGYTPTRLSFQKELSKAVRRTSVGGTGVTNARHIPLKGAPAAIGDVQGKIISTPSPTVGRDGNGVELEREMAAMSENQIMLNAAVQMLKAKFSSYQTAIKGGM